MILFGVLLIVFISALTIVYVVYNHIKKTEKQKYYAAAGNILREEYLNYSLRNTIDGNSEVPEPKSAKMMIYLKSKSSGKKTQFVFDPEKTVRIGRDNSSNIFINEALVSQEHCLIYASGDRVYLQDLGSANGTVVKRGAFKSYTLFDLNQIELLTGDVIQVGSSQFKVCLFYYDLAAV